MSYPSVIHHGGVESVTGSCHQLEVDPLNSLLIDCGLRLDGVTDQPALPFSRSSTVKALILTHAHIDHVGRIPDLLAAGYRGPIICSEPCARMLILALEDASKHSFRYDSHQMQRYLVLVQQMTVTLAFDSWHEVINTPASVVRIRLQRAGHILGSAYV